MDLGAQSSPFKGQTGIIYIQNQRRLATRINSFGSVSFHTKFHSWLPTPERLKWSEYCASFPPVGRVNHELLAPGAVTSCLISPTLIIFTIWMAQRACLGAERRVQSGCALSVPRGFQGNTRYSPEEPAEISRLTALNRRLSGMTSRDPFRPDLPRDPIVLTPSKPKSINLFSFSH